MRCVLVVVSMAAVLLSACAGKGKVRPAPDEQRQAPLGSQVTRPAPSADALQARVRAELKLFTDWLAANRVKGFLGEVGWPDDGRGDAAKWNALADVWYQDANAAGLWVTTWAAGDWWPATYPMAMYRDQVPGVGIDTPNSQAEVLERHGSTERYVRGINVAGAQFATPNIQPTHAFSNVNLGVHGKAYLYPTQVTLEYLASRGVKVVRLPFRWERLQPKLGEPFDPAELQRLREAITRAGRAGLEVILDVHNYGAYYLHDGTSGVRRAIGSRDLPVAHFVDLWRRLSTEFQSNRVVLAYGLMNEPIDLPESDGVAPSRIWERASQAALEAIRGNGDRKLVLVAGYFWSGVKHFPVQHPKAWIVDPADNVRYEAHQYFDHNSSGEYLRSYADEVLEAAAAGY